MTTPSASTQKPAPNGVLGKAFSLLPKILLALAVVALLVQFGAVLYHYGRLAWTALNFPYPLDYGEGPLLDQTLRLSQGENIYRNDFSVPPYTISNYPPMFILVQAPLAWIFGPALWYGRFLSILSAVLTGVFIALTLHTLTEDWLSAAVGGLLLLAFPYIQHWSLFNRIDELALVLSWAALFVTVRFIDRRWGLFLAGLLFVGAIYTRQTYAASAPFAAFVWLLFMRGWRRAFQLAFLVGGVSLGLFLLINLLTQGGFYLNIVVSNVNPFHWDTVRNYARDIRRYLPILLTLAGIFLLLERFIGKQRTRTWPLVLPYLLAAAATSVTVGKEGSNVNYLLEFAAALSLTTGAALAWLRPNPWLRALVLFLVAFQASVMLNWTQDKYTEGIYDRVAHQESIARLAQMVRESDEIVLADEYMGLVPLAGKRLYIQPFEFKQMSDMGVWDQTPFLLDVMNHKPSLILWYQPGDWNAVESRWTGAMRDMINSTYQYDITLAEVDVLRPRPK